MADSPSVYTCGYEGRSQKDVISALAAARIEHLVDVRWRPNSRKPGLSRVALTAALAEHGIRYTHLQGLGTPPEIMAGLRSGAGYDWDAYEQFLLEQRRALEEGTAAAAASRTALLCFEAAPEECHRRVVARHLGAAAGLSIVHL